MKAIVYENYGSPDVLQLKEIDKPVPGDNEILLEVRTAAITPMDWHFMTDSPFLARIMAGDLFKPKHKVLGTPASGVVENVSGSLTHFQPGDDVFGRSSKGGSLEYSWKLFYNI
jgi:NADPH:quinone reductase-like Zn-dependent oxidoreductase